MSNRAAALGGLSMKALAADRGVSALDDGSCVLLLIADQIDACEEKEAPYHFHMWAAAVRFMGRALSDEADEMRGFMRLEAGEGSQEGRQRLDRIAETGER